MVFVLAIRKETTWGYRLYVQRTFDKTIVALVMAIIKDWKEQALHESNGEIKALKCGLWAMSRATFWKGKCRSRSRIADEER